MRRFAMPVAALTLLLAGCGPAAADADPAAAPLTSAPATKKSTTSAAAAPIVLGDYDPSADASADLRSAVKAASKDGKPVLVDFGADWCPDCVVLRKLATQQQVQGLLGKYHVVSVDVGEFDRNLDVADDLTLDLQSSGIPALVVLSPKGKVRTATNDGSFSSARSMEAKDVAAFLKKWK